MHFFSDSSVVSLKSWPWPKYIQYGTFFQKNMFYYQTFFLLQLCSLVLSKYMKEKIGGTVLVREKENLFPYRAQFERNLLYFVRARAHVRGLMTRKSCAVEMHNAILRNYLKSISCKIPEDGDFLRPSSRLLREAERLS